MRGIQTINKLNKEIRCPYWEFNRRTRATTFGSCTFYDGGLRKDCIYGEGCKYVDWKCMPIATEVLLGEIK